MPPLWVDTLGFTSVCRPAKERSDKSLRCEEPHAPAVCCAWGSQGRGGKGGRKLEIWRKLEGPGEGRREEEKRNERGAKEGKFRDQSMSFHLR